jgi:large subunit ribosomal protein L15
MQAHQLKPPPGAKHARKRVGRGNSAGQGTYSGRGLKGQKSRSGNKPRRFFEGGQTRLFKKLPFRRGFTNPFRVEYQPINLDDLQKLDEGTDVTPELLKERGVVRTLRKPVKVLATGEITKKLSVTAHRFSLAAKEKIEAAGGTVTELTERKQKKERTRKAKKGGPKPSPEAGEATVSAEAPAEEAETPQKPQAKASESEDNGSGG